MMKIKDMIDLKGCHSAHAVGELYVVDLSINKMADIINKEPLPELCEKWEYSKRIAQALYDALKDKRNK